jgi:1,4-alpha-glucan branching enzyme
MLSQHQITAATPTGACLVPGGATFKIWAPRALAVYLNGRFGGTSFDLQTPDRLLSKDPKGYWTGFQPGAVDGDA